VVQPRGSNPIDDRRRSVPLFLAMMTVTKMGSNPIDDMTDGQRVKLLSDSLMMVHRRTRCATVKNKVSCYAHLRPERATEKSRP